MKRSRLTQAVSAIAVAAALIVARPAAADVLRPGYLEMKEIGTGLYEVQFKTPTLNGARLKISAVLPSNCESVTPVAVFEAQAALIERWTVRCQGPLAGQTLAIDGLRTVSTDVLIRIQPQEGGAITTRLRPVSTSFVVPEAPSAWNVAQTYLVFGVEHILGGIDHLLFVFALLLIVQGHWLLLDQLLGLRSLASRYRRAHNHVVLTAVALQQNLEGGQHEADCGQREEPGDGGVPGDRIGDRLVDISCRDVVVLGGDRQVGAANGAAREAEPLERLW